MIKKCGIPSAFPAEGTFEFGTIHIHLASVTPEARIHYTLDGSEPDKNSPVYIRKDGLLLMQNMDDCHEYTLKAYAEADGMENSRVETFIYRFACRKKGTYRHAMIRELGERAPAIVRIEDYELDKMFLVIGTEKAVLIDAGWDAEGDLVGLCRELIGNDIPLELIVAHGHPDHIEHARHFTDAGITTYIPYADKETVASFGREYLYDLPLVKDINKGMVFDLGN